jgi:hypothetical protein
MSNRRARKTYLWCSRRRHHGSALSLAVAHTAAARLLVAHGNNEYKYSCKRSSKRTEATRQHSFSINENTIATAHNERTRSLTLARRFVVRAAVVLYVGVAGCFVVDWAAFYVMTCTVSHYSYDSRSCSPRTSARVCVLACLALVVGGCRCCLGVFTTRLVCRAKRANKA